MDWSLCGDEMLTWIIQALYVLYNIALGSDAHRDAILSRRPILQGLKKALVGC
jgi:hypothetical protein